MQPKSAEDVTRPEYRFIFTDYPSALYRAYTVSVAILHLVCVLICTPALLWALRVLFQHVRRDHIKFSIYTLFLLLTDIVELCLVPVIVASVLTEDSVTGDTKDTVIFAVYATRLCGLCFHQLVAQESLLSSNLTSPFHSIPICFTVCLSTFFPLLCPSFMLLVACALITGTLAVAMHTSCVALCSRADTTAKPTASGTKRVLAVAMGTLLLLYTPNFLLIVTAHIVPVPNQVSVVVFCMLSLRLITEPWLSLLACRITHLKFSTDL